MMDRSAGTQPVYSFGEIFGGTVFLDEEALVAEVDAVGEDEAAAPDEDAAGVQQDGFSHAQPGVLSLAAALQDGRRPAGRSVFAEDAPAGDAPVDFDAALSEHWILASGATALADRYFGRPLVVGTDAVDVLRDARSEVSASREGNQAKALAATRQMITALSREPRLRGLVHHTLALTDPAAASEFETLVAEMVADVLRFLAEKSRQPLSLRAARAMAVKWLDFSADAGGAVASAERNAAIQARGEKGGVVHLLNLMGGEVDLATHAEEILATLSLHLNLLRGRTASYQSRQEPGALRRWAGAALDIIALIRRPR